MNRLADQFLQIISARKMPVFWFAEQSIIVYILY